MEAHSSFTNPQTANGSVGHDRAVYLSGRLDALADLLILLNTASVPVYVIQAIRELAEDVQQQKREIECL